MIDLHQHTLLSDGTDSVEELIKKNKKKGMQVISITDHDNIESVASLKNLSKKYNIAILSGVEFSTDFNGESIHLLCYGFDTDDVVVKSLIDEGIKLRHARVSFRLENLKNEFNINLDESVIKQINKSPNPNKPMIANVLKGLGYGDNISEIIKKFLYHKMPDYKLKTVEVLNKLKSSTGVSVYAHPLGGVGEKRVKRDIFEYRLKHFVDAGLKALECYYSLYSKEEQEYLVAIAKKYNLFVSGGSDYHGTNKNVQIGELSNYGYHPNLSEINVIGALGNKVNKWYLNFKRIKKNWLENYDKINDFLKSILRVDFDLKTTGYIVSPNLFAGNNIGDNKFVWGHRIGIKDPNYDLVYLVHESLHSLLERDNLAHAVLENISDVELARELNGFNSCGYETHNFTKDYHIKIFPFWNLYMKRTKKEIMKEQKLFNIKYDIDKFEVYREKLEKMNIFELMDFLKIETEKVKFKELIKLDL